MVRTSILGDITLVSRLTRGALGNDRRIIGGERWGVDPCADRHTAGELQRGRVAEIYEVIHAIECYRIAVFSGCESRTVRERADDAMARGIRRRGAGDLVERVARRDAERVRGQQQARLERFKDELCRGGGALAVDVRLSIGLPAMDKLSRQLLD